MKKIYLSFLAIGGLAIGANAQESNPVHSFASRAEKITPGNGVLSVTKTSSKKKAVDKTGAIWSEDFGALVINNPSMGTFTTANGTWILSEQDSVHWEVGTDPNDALGYANNMTAPYLQWNTYGEINASGAAPFATQSVIGAAQTPVIDLSSATSGNITMQFNTQTVYCCNSTQFPWLISVSTDGGTTFNTPSMLNFGLDRNDLSSGIASPLPYQVNISPLFNGASNLSNVVIKFTWDGEEADGNGQTNEQYFWLLDDISLFETLGYELEAKEMYLGDANNYEQTSIPKEFGGAGHGYHLSFQVITKNNGQHIPTTTHAKYTIYDATNAVMSTNTGGSLNSNFANGTIDTLTYHTGFDVTTLPVGTYTLEAVLETGSDTDEDNNNDTVVRTFQVTQGLYGQRNYERPRYIGSVGKSQGTGTGATATSKPMTYGNVMRVPQDINLTGLEVSIGRSTNYPTTVGQDIEIQIWHIDSTATTIADRYVNDGISRTYTIDSSMIPHTTSGVVNYVFNFFKPTFGPSGAVPLSAKNLYWIVVKQFGGLNNHIAYVYNSGDTDNSSIVKGSFSTAGGESWYGADGQLHLRMDFDKSLGLGTHDANEFSVSASPNPFVNQTDVHFTLENAADVSVIVTDMTGRQVLNIPAANFGAGMHSIALDGTQFNAGVYNYTLKVGNDAVTNRIVKK